MPSHPWPRVQNWLWFLNGRGVISSLCHEPITGIHELMHAEEDRRCVNMSSSSKKMQRVASRVLEEACVCSIIPGWYDDGELASAWELAREKMEKKNSKQDSKF